MNGHRETTSRRRSVLNAKARTGIGKEKRKNNTLILVFELFTIKKEMPRVEKKGKFLI
jgi:hypothetical protein